jgi:hypothetical protein
MIVQEVQMLAGQALDLGQRTTPSRANSTCNNTADEPSPESPHASRNDCWP